MSFKNKKYIVIKKAISKELADFCFNYFLIKRSVADTFYNEKFYTHQVGHWGIWNDPQVPNVYSHYADICMETLLLKCKSLMEKHTKLKLIPTYSYARIYEKGATLFRHKDRPSCEISTTMNLGGDPWPIYIDPTGEDNISDRKFTNKGEEVKIKKGAHKGVKVDLSPGDMLVYSGCDLEHWRKPFKGKDCAQVFLHYNNVKTQGNTNLYDGRKHVGLPKGFQRK
jgi:hypothetical protein